MLQYRDELIRFAHKHGSRDPEDCVQNAYLKSLGKIRKSRALLYKIVRDEVTTEHRRRKYEHLTDIHVKPEIRDDRLEALLATLNRDESKFIRDVYNGGYATTAAAAGVTCETARQRAHRIIVKLRGLVT